MDTLSEELILIAGNQTQVEDNIEKANAIFLYHQLLQEPNAFHWFLTELHNFKNSYTREIAIGRIADTIHTYWNTISPSLYDDISEEFFNVIFSDRNYMEDKFLTKIYQIEADVIHQFYPRRWPTFFSEIVQVPKPRLYGFLAQFNISMYGNSSIIFRDVQQLQQNMLKDGSQLLLLQTVLNDTANGEVGAALAISNIVEWIDQSIIGNLGVIQTFFELLQEPDTRDEAIQCIFNFIKREHPVDQLADFIQETNLADTLFQLVSNDLSEQSAISISKIINHLSILGLGDPFYETAKILFEMNNLFINEKATEFIRKFVINNTDYIDEIAELCLSKILDVIQNPTADQDIIIKRPLSILSTLSSLGASLSESLLSLAAEVDIDEKIAGCATIITALMLFFKDNPDQETLLAVVQTFRSLLDIPPPYEFSYIAALAAYTSLSKPFLIQEENEEFALSVFGACVSAIDGLETRDSSFEQIAEAISVIGSAHPEPILAMDEADDIINLFIESHDKKLMATANRLIGFLDDAGRDEKYGECLSFFADYVSEAGDGGWTRLQPVFDFIGDMRCGGSESLRQAALEFFEEIAPVVDSNRSLYAPFVRASVRLLGTDAFQLFWGAVGVLECDSYTAIAEAALSLDAPDDILMVTNLLLEKLKSVPLTPARNQTRSGDDLMAEDLYTASVRFFMRSGVYEMLDSAGKHAVMDVVNEIITKSMPSYQLMTEIITFQDRVITPETLVQTLVHSNLLTYVLSTRRKPAADREACRVLLEVYIGFSHKQAMFNPVLFVNTADNAYTGQQIPATNRMDYLITASTEDPAEYEKKKAELIEQVLSTYDLEEE